MAKGQQRGNREAKKPKQNKPKAAPAPSAFTVPPAKTNASAPRPAGAKK